MQRLASCATGVKQARSIAFDHTQGHKTPGIPRHLSRTGKIDCLRSHPRPWSACDPTPHKSNKHVLFINYKKQQNKTKKGQGGQKTHQNTVPKEYIVKYLKLLLEYIRHNNNKNKKNYLTFFFLVGGSSRSTSLPARPSLGMQYSRTLLGQQMFFSHNSSNSLSDP